MQKTNIATIKMIHIHNENLIFHSDKHLLMAWLYSQYSTVHLHTAQLLNNIMFNYTI